MPLRQIQKLVFSWLHTLVDFHKQRTAPKNKTLVDRTFYFLKIILYDGVSDLALIDSY